MKLAHKAKIKTFYGKNLAPLEGMTDEEASNTLLSVLETEHAKHVDIVAAASAMTLTKLPVHLKDDKTAIDFALQIYDPNTGDHMVAALTDLAHEQLSGRMGIHVRYYQSCGEVDPQKTEKVDEHHPLIWNVNYWLKTKALAHGRLLLRCYRDGDRLLLRSVLSDRYRIIDNQNLALTAVRTAIDVSKEQELRMPECFSWSISETGRLDFMLFHTGITADLDEPVGTKVNLGKHGRHDIGTRPEEAWRTGGTKGTANSTDFDPKNDGSGSFRMATPDGHDRSGGGQATNLVFSGVRIRNSETGGGRVEISVCAWVSACSNAYMLGYDLAQIHLGAKLGQHEELVLSRDTIQRDNEVFFQKVSDTVRAAFSAEKFQELVDSIRKSKEVKTIAPADALNVVGRKHDVVKSLRDEILMAFRAETPGKTTLFDLVQGMTAAASSGIRERDPEKAYDLEKAASELLTNTPKEILEKVPA